MALNPYTPTDSQIAPRNAQTAIASTRAAQQVQGAIVSAKHFPRNEFDAAERIRAACQRQTLADQAMYAYTRGGQTVTGPSIRLAEVLARAWGNVDFGIVEIEQRTGAAGKSGVSVVESYCWDLETNTRVTRTFEVKHERHTKAGVKPLVDPRDIYELAANQGARRLRACILEVIPGDVVDMAVSACKETIKAGGGVPLIDRIRRAVAAFAEVGVTTEMLERRLGHPLANTTADELPDLQAIYKALKDGHGKRADFFDVPGARSDAATTASIMGDAPGEPEPDWNVIDAEAREPGGEG